MLGATEFFGSKFAGHALDSLDWAKAAGYACRHAPGSDFVPDDLEHAEMPYVWHEVRKDALALAERGFNMAEGASCCMLVHNGARIYQMLFSSADDLHAEEVEWLPTPVGEGTQAGGDIRLVFDMANQRFPFDLSEAKDIVEVDEPHIYVRTPYNFGHWVLDHLSTLLSAQHFFPDIAACPLALTMRHEDQRVLFNALGFGDDRLHFFEAPPGQSRIFHFKKLYVPSSGRNALGYELVRRRVSEIALPMTTQAGGKRLYFSRRHFYPRHRVANQDEVEALLSERGFDILTPELMDPLDLLGRVREAEIIALPFGASNGNLAMSSQHCQILSLTPEFFASDQFDSLLLRGQRRYLLPFYNRIHFVPGRPENEKDEALGKDGKLYWGLGTLDAPHHYDIRAIDHALMMAEKALLRAK